jgi:hypothetical protein
MSYSPVELQYLTLQEEEVFLFFATFNSFGNCSKYDIAK